MAKYCSNCGKEVKEGADICLNCGKMINGQTRDNVNKDPNAKSKIVGGILGILLGCFGVHNFYLGYTSKAIAQLLITLLSSPYKTGGILSLTTTFKLFLFSLSTINNCLSLSIISYVSYLFSLISAVPLIVAKSKTPDIFSLNLTEVF